MPAFDPNAKKMLISGNEAISLSMRHKERYASF